MEILTPWIGEILALGMLLVLNARVFWTRRTRLDALSLLGATAFVTMIFETLAWGLRVSGVAILALSFICVIVNYRSLVRFSQRLFVDSYSIKFFVTSLLLLAASVFFIAVEIQARPVRLQTRLFNVQVEREYFSCPLSQDNFPLKKAREATDKRNLTLYTFSNKNKENQKDAVIVFTPDVLAEALAYEPYFILLARKGWTVLAADLYNLNFKSPEDFSNTKSFRRASLIWSAYSSGGKKAVKEQKFPESRARAFHEIYEYSYRALEQIARERYPGKKIFVVGDSSSFLPTQKLETIFAAARFLNLKDIPEYTTPGYGFVAQTNPIFSWLFFGIKRDKTSFEPSWCATQTIKKLSSRGD